MLIDTHCHLNLTVKKGFESPMTDLECQNAKKIIDEAQNETVTILICVGTNKTESDNCIKLARIYQGVFASVGIHPNDATDTWPQDITYFKSLLKNKDANKIVAIGECGIDRHYPGYNLQMQKDLFRAQIELALEYDRALIVHSRDAGDETLYVLDEYADENLRGTMHCFSYDLAYAQESIRRNFVLGIGGTITYPKNNDLRDIVRTVGIREIVLETDSPYLPPQSIRGQKNTPAQIKTIAEYIGELVGLPLDEVALTTSGNARNLFRLP
jgi:TatD DNase family protein